MKRTVHAKTEFWVTFFFTLLIACSVLPSFWLYSAERSDSSQIGFLKSYQKFLEKQAHFGLWEGEILRKIRQNNQKTLEFRQTVQAPKLDWLLENQPVVPFRDAADEWVSTHSGGGYAPFLASAGRGGAFGKNPYGWQGKPRRHLNFIPSELELDVLSALWDDPLQTDLELYRSLSARWPITAEQFQKILAGMADEGLLARKQISPQNLFSIFLPFGVIYVEESSLNRKNRVFVYRPTVRQKQVISVLMQKLETSTLSESEKKAYREKLKRLLEIEK